MSGDHKCLPPKLVPYYENVIKIEKDFEENRRTLPPILQPIIDTKVSNYNKIKKLFKCNECLKEFKTSEGLKYHKLIRENKQQFKCNECKKTFNLKFHLKSHQLIHSNEKQFVCDWNGCGKRFKTKPHLIEPKRCVHLTEKFECKIKLLPWWLDIKCINW